MTPAERLRQHQRALAKAQRELDRERTKLEQQEKKLVADIKRSAKAGQLVRIRYVPRMLAHVIIAECVQSDGQGPCPHETIHAEVLPNAHAAAGRRSADTDLEEQPANGGGHAGRDPRTSCYRLACASAHAFFVLGDGCYEPRTEPPPNTTYHERV